MSVSAATASIAWGEPQSAKWPVADSARHSPTLTRAIFRPEAPFDTIDMDWHDQARKRPIPVRIYWPGAAAKHPVPMIVFSHGIGGSRSGYSYLGRYWAGNGIASLHVQHVGSDRSLWFGNIFTLLSRLRNAAREAEAIDRVHDLRFALDRLLESEFGTHVDRSRIVAAGHSYGANTVLLAAGAKVERDGARLQLHDPRLSAAIVISAPPFYGESNLGAVLAGVRIPTLHVTATADQIDIPGFHSPPGDRIKVFEATGSALKTLAVFAGGSHSIFTDRSGTGGLELNPQVKAATQALSIAFLMRVFDHSDNELAAWGETYRPLIARYMAGQENGR